VELTHAIVDGKNLSNIDGISYRIGDNIYENADRKLIRYIDQISFPAYALAGDLNRYPGAQPVLNPPSMHIMSSCGCSFHCIFCTKSVWENTVRFRTPQNIVDEIEFLHKKFGINEIFFQDDTMNLNRKWFFFSLRRNHCEGSK
jgi:anaerobic magnesium-protoporphyrin IX monomethyl ester cyclase